VKKSVTFLGLVAAGAGLGFLVGLGIGKETREAAPSNVETSYGDGVVTIKADVGQTVKQGVVNWLSGS
jgi:hypothetical protein